MEDNQIVKLNLQLLAEGDGGGAEQGTGAEAQEAAVPVNPKWEKRHPLANVQIGIGDKQEQPQGQAPAVQAQEEKPPKEETFDDLIKGKYKADYDARVRQIVKDRLRNSKDAETKLHTLAPALAAWGEKLGIPMADIGTMDVDAFVKAVMDDNSMYEKEAEERGLPVEVVKQVHQLKAEKAQRERMDAQSRQEQLMQAHFQKIVSQAEAVKQMYPDFDLMREMDNPDFARLTSPDVGVDVRTAYEVIHNTEIQQQTMAYAVSKSQEKLTNAIAAQGARPAENGASGTNQAVNPYADPRGLTPAARAEIRRRVALGDRSITF